MDYFANYIVNWLNTAVLTRQEQRILKETSAFIGHKSAYFKMWNKGGEQTKWALIKEMKWPRGDRAPSGRSYCGGVGVTLG